MQSAVWVCVVWAILAQGLEAHTLRTPASEQHPLSPSENAQTPPQGTAQDSDKGARFLDQGDTADRAARDWEFLNGGRSADSVSRDVRFLEHGDESNQARA